MNPPIPKVLSASRRTDIPAFYMPWFMDGIERGVFDVVNPYNQRIFRVDATPERVHSIVFWSKDFGRFLGNRYGEKLRQRGYHLYFNFTVNGESSVLEPRVPPLAGRLLQMEDLARRFGGQCMAWRFDPICFYRVRGEPVCDNLADFEAIADVAERCGIRRCITSFMDPYPKVRRRSAGLCGVVFEDPMPQVKVRILLDMARKSASRGIGLEVCCEKSVLDMLPADAGIAAASCIPNDRLQALFGNRLSLRRDQGQRVRNGCGCRISADIGSYERQPCEHRCLYCYANK